MQDCVVRGGMIPPSPEQSALKAEAVQHLKRALDCLDRAQELRAAPYVQMAVDRLEGWTPDQLDMPECE